jgi:hypothetical protein
MNTKLGNTILRIIIQIVCFILLGLLVFGKYILIPGNTGFTFTIFGITAILFYYYRINTTTKNYILLGALYSILVIIIFMRSSHISVLSRNMCWFILIGLLADYHALAEKKEWYLNSKAWSIIIWLAGFVCVYAVMTFLNIFIYHYYSINEQATIWLYLKQIIKIGGVLGFGIGLGQFISGYLFKEKLS